MDPTTHTVPYYLWERGDIGAIRIMVDGERSFYFHSNSCPRYWNPLIMKFSPHFDNLLAARFLFEPSNISTDFNPYDIHVPPSDPDYPTEAYHAYLCNSNNVESIKIDEENNIYFIGNFNRSEYAATDIGRATRGAANAALAKVYLTWAQVDDDLTDAQRNEYFDLSAQYAQKVIDSGEYQLEEDFYDNWNNKNRNGKESIFAIQFYMGSSTRQGDASGNNHLCHCSFSTGFSVSLPHIAPGPDNELRDSYLEDDQRKSVTIVDSLWRPSTNSYFHFYFDNDGDGIKESGYSRFNKYIDHDSPETSASDRAMNRQVIRLAEVYLLLAEAINERDGQPNQEAYDAFNKVRRRAFREDINSNEAQPHDLEAGLDYEGFRNAIIQERSWELTLEQKHLFDLKRWKILVKTIKNSKIAKEYPEYNKQTIDFKHYRYPIPQAQREVNPYLWQNYGYDGSTITSNPYVGRE